MRILRAEDYRVMRWKNGQGATREIAVYPEGASLDNFMWRVSLAQVNAPGPFSLFRDCDRILCVVRGGPLYLSVAKAQPVHLEIDTPFNFAADIETEAIALQEPVLDFNVMVRRGYYRASIECCREPVNLSASSHVRLVFVKEGTAKTGGEVLRDGDTLFVGGEQTMIATAGSTVLYVVTLMAAIKEAFDPHRTLNPDKVIE
jgi:environmental stress-induced protein Ves